MGELFLSASLDTMKSLPFLSESHSTCEISACGLTLNISRQRLSDSQWKELIGWGQKKGIISSLQEMMSGAIVNRSEGRQVLHTSLRSRDPQCPHYNEVQSILVRMKRLARDVRGGQWRGVTGLPITDVVNVGIGGSDMGPRAVYHALRTVKPKIRLHFLSAVDGVLLDRVFGELNPETTLFVISSKSFSTRETMVNASAVDQWLTDAGISTFGDRAKHILVVSANPTAFKTFNLPAENQFSFWDWVGGRFSVWSAVGLPLMIALGEEVFQEFLDGAQEIDQHLIKASLEKNLPVILALLAYYSHSKLQLNSHCLLPYDERLRLLVLWLQQLEMESLGKAHSMSGKLCSGVTGQMVWGGMGNEAQHSFYQWLREGLSRTNIDILWSRKPGHSHSHHHKVLVANAMAQAEALVKVEREESINAVSTIVIDELTPKTLGALMAVYEHKTAILGLLYDVNAFDQPGVEYGKRLCRELEDLR